MKVRVRFAPSPTGYLHVGSAHTALFNWLFARHHGGIFVLRIEDTDQKRRIPGIESAILDGFRWLGLDWDEGPEVGGPFGPYYQSERLKIYHNHANLLLSEGKAYLCFCSPERLATLRKEQLRRGAPPGYDRHCRELTLLEKSHHESSGVKPVIRLKIPIEGTTSFIDALHGEITWNNSQLDDLVLMKSDGFPTYHLANVVDDHLMDITHIMRGVEWIASTPRHIVIYSAFGWSPPKYAHLALLVDENHKKLSKRKGAVSIQEFREQGYLPEAMINFMALMGWSLDDKKETFSLAELIANFDLDRIGKTPSIFDSQKLYWLNGVYIRSLRLDDLASRLVPFLQKAGIKADPEMVQRIAPLIQERIKLLSEAPALTDFFFQARLDYEPRLLLGKGLTATQSEEALRQARGALETIQSFDEAHIEPALRGLAQNMGWEAGKLFGVLRVAVTGKTVAPPLFGTMAVLGKERVLERVEFARRQLATLVPTARK